MSKDSTLINDKNDNSDSSGSKIIINIGIRFRDQRG